VIIKSGRLRDVTGLIGKAEARDILRAHQGTLLGCYDLSWESWKKIEKGIVRVAPRYRATSRANLFYDLLTEQIEAAFADTAGVSMSRRLGFLTLTFDGRLVVRFKKFRGKSLKTSQIMTFQQERLSRQELDLGLNVTTIVVGYVLDPLGAELTKIAAACPLEGENVWTLSLDDDEFGQFVLPISLPSSGAPKPIIRSKPGATRKNPKNDSDKGQ
jgi:hypothetical protein